MITPLVTQISFLAQLFHLFLINFLNFKLQPIVRCVPTCFSQPLQEHMNKHIKTFFLCSASCLINFADNILLHLIRGEAQTVRVSVVVCVFYCPNGILPQRALGAEELPDDDRIKNQLN